MSWARAAVILAVLSLAAAVLLALLSRTPAEVRRAGPGPNATEPARGAGFSDAQIARHGAYQKARYGALLLSLVLHVVTLVILARGLLGRLVELFERVPGGWWSTTALSGITVIVVLALVTLPLAFVRGYVVQHAWGLSTQSWVAWFVDRGRGLAVSSVIGVIAAIAFFGVVRWQPRTWWVWGWLAFAGLSALLAYLWPIVIAPLFNKFEPLEGGPLRDRVVALAQSAEVDVGEVFVVDASKRSTMENAYVAGLGNSKQLVLYDTLVRAGDEDETAFVVAHELGHQVERHVVKNVLLTTCGLFVGFAVLAWLAGRTGAWAWAGADGIGDVRAIPILLLFAIGANVVVLPIESAIARSFERRADQIALRLTDDRDTAVRVFRRLAFSNLSDLKPPAAAVWALFSHPPVADRIRLALAHGGRGP
jgi:STE24 endopeptidase